MRPIALARLLLSGFTVEHAAEQISKQVIHISALKVERMESTILSIAALWARTGATCPTSVKRCVTVLIILRFLFRIAQRAIRLCNLLKVLLRRRIILICIRMIFFCKFSICFLSHRHRRFWKRRALRNNLSLLPLLPPFCKSANIPGSLPGMPLTGCRSGHHLCSTCNITLIHNGVNGSQTVHKNFTLLSTRLAALHRFPVPESEDNLL